MVLLQVETKRNLSRAGGGRSERQLPRTRDTRLIQHSSPVRHRELFRKRRVGQQLVVHVRCDRDCVATAPHPLCVGAPGAGVYPLSSAGLGLFLPGGCRVFLGGFDSLKWAGKNISVDLA